VGRSISLEDVRAQFARPSLGSGDRLDSLGLDSFELYIAVRALEVVGEVVLPDHLLEHIITIDDFVYYINTMRGHHC